MIYEHVLSSETRHDQPLRAVMFNATLKQASFSGKANTDDSQ